MGEVGLTAQDTAQRGTESIVERLSVPKSGACLAAFAGKAGIRL